MFSIEASKVLVKREWTRLAWKWSDLTGGDGQVVNVLGDSHTRYFRHLQATAPLRRTRLRVFNVTGATASGLKNPSSKTRAVASFRSLLRTARRDQALLLQLGEVDCGFAMWMRAERRRTPIEVELEDAIGHYLDFVAEIRGRGFRRVMLATVPPPTIEDWNRWRGPIGHLRRQVKADLPERSRVTRLFNQRLRLAAPGAGFDFLDVEDALVDPHTAIVRPELLSEEPGDLHLNNERTARIYRGALERAGFE
jgi:hypothetical protein